MVSAAYLLAVLTGSLAGLLLALPLWRGGRPAPAVALALAVGLGTTGLYAAVGQPDAIDHARSARLQAEDLASNTAALRASLAAEPDQAEGWLLLARAEALLGNPDAAAAAWTQVLTREPDVPALLVEAAQARADAHPQRQIDDQALAWLERAQQIDPQAQRALWLIGIAQRQRGQPAQAAATWQRLLALLDGSTAGSVREQVDKARADAGLPPLPEAGVTAAAPLLRVRVALDPALASRIRLDPQTPVFVQVHDLAGTPMPVAARRLQLGDLPAEVVLDDGDSVMPTALLSAQPQVRVQARISVSGSAQRSQGDVLSPALAVDLPASAPVLLELSP